MIKTCVALYSDPRLAPRLAMEKETLWEPGQTIRVSFMNGSAIQQGVAMSMMSEWLQYANLRYKFGDDIDKADARVAFGPNEGSWSYVGRQCLYADNNEPTMNFGWLDEETPEEEWRRVVLHETGHMLGAIHEHQSPKSNIQWRKAVMYKYFWETQGWSAAEVNKNILDKYNRRSISNSEFDPESIMLYPIPAEFTHNGFSVGWNGELSDIDRKFIEKMYP